MIKQGLTFDDVLLEPQFSDINSRTEVNISTRLGTLDLKIPILSANMDTVTEDKMAAAMGQLGGLGVLHRYTTKDTVMGWLKTGGVPSVGIKKEDLDKAWAYRSLSNSVCLDVAHGDSKQVIETIKQLLKMGFTNIIAGNVATPQATLRLFEAGANIIKVGVGPGSVCTTRIVTGHGVPQLTAISESKQALKDAGYDGFIVGDGGIRTSGDIVKALAAGADAVMLGSLLAGTDESPAAQMGVYRGMASADAQVNFRGNVSNGTAEGVAHKVTLKGPVSKVIENLCGGIRSGLSYSGCRTIKELHDDAIFIRITSNGLIESHPHGLK